MIYENPVRRGFFPDPSVIRVGSDYYMVNSSFQYFPAIPVSHSKDMIHWNIIGHAIENPDYLDLSDINDSHGIWASDISYWNGRFYIFATLRLNGDANAPVSESNHPPFRRQLIVSAEKAEGPWSKPVYIELDDIDPSHFVDDILLPDGSRTYKHYMLIAPGVRALELSDDLTRAVGQVKTVWKGTGLRCPEGPHIWKHTLENGDTWYYAILAEGGTGYGHRISVARSKSLFGPYEESPYNPVMTQTDADSPIQRCGHGKPVQALDGSWWMYYLCARPLRDADGKSYTVSGRETALDAIQFTDDGWFTVNSGKGPSLNATIAESVCEKINISAFESDSFRQNEKKMDLKNFQFVRNPDKNNFDFCSDEFKYTIFLQKGKLFQKEAKNTLLMREASHKIIVSVQLDFIPEESGDEAGLTSYYSTTTYVSLSLRSDEKKRRILLLAKNSGSGESGLSKSQALPSGKVILKMQKDGLKRTFSAAIAEEPEKEIFSYTLVTEFLSDEGNKAERKRHTGCLTGMYANCTENHTGKKAVFTDFQMTDL